MDYYDMYDMPDIYYDSYYSSYNSVAASIIMSYVWGFIIALIAIWVFTVLIRWKMFEKAGVAGWKSIIPIYGDYVEYTIVWEGKWYWFTLIATFVGCFAFGIPLVGPIVSVAALVFLEIVTVIFAMQKAKAFGQGTGFAVGLVFLSFVFTFFIAFDQDIVYRGPQPSPKFFGTVRQQLPGGQPAYQPVQPNTYQQAYGQPQYYAPQAAPVAPQAAPVAPQPAPVAPQAAPVAPTAPLPQATTAPEAAPEPAPETEADDEPIEAPTDGTVPVPRFDPETGLPLQ